MLVVGPGCSGMEIAYDLAEGGAAEVWLSVRTPPNILLREGPAGLPGDYIGLALLRFPVRFADAFTNFGRRMDLGDLSEYGLPIPEEGVFARAPARHRAVDRRQGGHRGDQGRTDRGGARRRVARRDIASGSPTARGSSRMS